MVAGAIEYRQLQASSFQIAARFVAILCQNPELQQLWFGKLNDPALSEDDRNQHLFLLSARWPDDIRSNVNDYPTWHYVNFIYVPEQGIARTETALVTGENILLAFQQNRPVLLSNATDSAKAITLCWIFHLTGYVHMSLHTTALIGNQLQLTEIGKAVNKLSYVSHYKPFMT